MSAIQLGPSNAANRFEAKERLEKRTKAKGLSGDSWGVFANVGLAEEAKKQHQQWQQQQQQQKPNNNNNNNNNNKNKNNNKKKNNRRLTKVAAQGSHVQDR